MSGDNMRHNTGNPIGPSGSNDPRDLSDNAGIIDQYTNGQLASYPDRFGAPRQSLAGMRTKFDQDQANRLSQFNSFIGSQGFVDLGSYDDGPLTITAASQMFKKDGAYWSPSPALSLPYTTINNWAADKHNFVNRGDGAVRTQLAEVTANLDAVADKIVVDLHYGICRGVGYNGSGGERVTTVTVAAAAGAGSLIVADPTGFVEGQLIVYRGADGEYRTVVVSTVSGSALLLQTPIESAIAGGAQVGIFYKDLSHPTVLGYRAIVDGAIRRSTKKYELVRTWRPNDEFALIAGATTAPYAATVYNNPGSASSPALHVTAPSIGAGIITGQIRIPAGDYLARVFVTPNLGGSAALAVRVSETPIGTIAQNTTILGPCPTVEELYFRKSKTGTVSVSLAGQQAGHQFAVSRVEIVRLTGNVRSLDRGVHVMNGDSWWAQPGALERFKECLPNATFINVGVAGSTALGAALRFFTDVAPYRPTFVWNIFGTNEVAGEVPPASFYAHCGILSQYIASIGATSIFLNCSVGSPTHPNFGDLLTRSREYVLNEDYVAQTADAAQSTEVYKAPINVTVPVGASYRVLIAGSTTKGATIRALYAVGQAGEVTGNVRMGYGTAVTGLNEDILSFELINEIRRNIDIHKATSLERFLMIEIQNTGDAALAVGGYIDLVWSPVR